MPKTILVDAKEYSLLKKIGQRYVEVAENLFVDAADYPYDLSYIKKLIQKTDKEYQNKNGIKAENINDALKQFQTQRKKK